MATDVNKAFSEFKSRLELSDTLQAAVTTHHTALRNWISGSDQNIETKLIGSLQRQTRIQPRQRDTFDIDILIILGRFNRWVDDGITPTIALSSLEDAVRNHGTYQKMGPETDNPTITLEYADETIAELVPAYRDYIGHYYDDGPQTQPAGRGYWIPQNNKWVLADYDYDASVVSEANKASDCWLIPTIKMLKAAKRNLFADMNSFHLEVVSTKLIPSAVAHYERNQYPIDYGLLIYAFFGLAEDGILEPSVLTGSNSLDVDLYMDNSRKQQLSLKFGELAAYCHNLLGKNGHTAIEGWAKVFGDTFPSYG